MIEVVVASAIVLAGTLIAVRATAFGDQPLGTPDVAPPAAPAGDIVPSEDDGLGFTTVLEEKGRRFRWADTVRLGVGLLLVGGALGLGIIAVVRGLAILWPHVFPAG